MILMDYLIFHTVKQDQCSVGGFTGVYSYNANFGNCKDMFRYRCHLGLEMEGHDTLYCDGRHWNGTVPTCLKVPEPPDLSILSAAKQTTTVALGEIVKITCLAVGGNPVPYVGLSWPESERIGELKRLEISEEFIVTEEHQHKKITCTAKNKAGQSESSLLLNITGV